MADSMARWLDGGTGRGGGECAIFGIERVGYGRGAEYR